ncbi:MAG: hypothetical protein ACFFDI_23825 [Promethearchaeota archaeon]
MATKVFHLGLCFISLFLLGTTIFVAGSPSVPNSAEWGCNEGDTFFWIINKLRINNEVVLYPIWIYYSESNNHFINGTEGDIIELTVLSLGNATDCEIQLRVRIGENEYITPVIKSNPLRSYIVPVFDRGYWEDVVDGYNSGHGLHQLINATLVGDILTVNGTFSGILGNYIMVLDITRGFLKKYEMCSTSRPGGELRSDSDFLLEIQIGLIEPTMSSGFETLGAILGLVLIAAVPVIFQRVLKVKKTQVPKRFF